MRGQALHAKAHRKNHLPSPPHLTLTLRADRRSPTTTPKHHDRVSRELPIQSTYNTNQLSLAVVSASYPIPTPPSTEIYSTGTAVRACVCACVTSQITRQLSPALSTPSKPRSPPIPSLRSVPAGEGRERDSGGSVVPKLQGWGTQGVSRANQAAERHPPCTFRHLSSSGTWEPHCARRLGGGGGW